MARHPGHPQLYWRLTFRCLKAKPRQTLPRKYSTQASSEQAPTSTRNPLSRTARARVEGVAAVQDVNRNRQPPRSSEGRPQRGPSAAGWRSVNLNQSQSRPPPPRRPHGSDAPQVLDLRNLAATPAPTRLFPRPGGPGRPGFPRPGGPGAGRRAVARPGRGQPGRRQQRGAVRRRRRQATKATGEGEEKEERERSKEDIELEAGQIAASQMVKTATINHPTPESLVGFIPKMPFGERGASATLHSALKAIAEPKGGIPAGLRVTRLGNYLIDGKYLYMRDGEEKEKVMEAAFDKVKEIASKEMEATGKVVKAKEPTFEMLNEEQRNAFLDKLFQGRYEPPVDSGRKGLVQDVVRQMRKNGTYSQRDEASLLGKLGSLLPAPAAARRQTRGKEQAAVGK